MRCFSPLTAWQTDSGEIVFAERGKIRRELTLPCGRCIGCRVNRTQQWAMRCMHEAQMHEHSWFVTLTYDDKHLPQFGSLHYPDFQKFMKRVRKAQLRSVRFYMCGEYGDEFSRPHFHACMFGLNLPDLEVLSKSKGNILYRSPKLEKLWPYGFVTIGAVTPESAAYVASYCLKKVTGKDSEDHYTRIVSETGEVVQVTPEFARMSLKPAIGSTWLLKYREDVYNKDGSDAVVMQGGFKVKPPRYYDKWLEKFDNDEFEWLKALRSNKEFDSVNSAPERIAAQEILLKARLNLKRKVL